MPPLFSNASMLRIYLRTQEGEVLLIELEREDLEKAAKNKRFFIDEEAHPVKLLRVELV